MKLTEWLVPMLVLAGCVEMTPYHQPSVYVSQSTPDALYAATVQVFLKKGWGFQSRDPIAHAIETEWMWSSRASACVSYRVLINRNGLDLYTGCKYGCSSLDRRCPEGERPRGFAEQENQLVQAILAEARHH